MKNINLSLLFLLFFASLTASLEHGAEFVVNNAEFIETVTQHSSINAELVGIKGELGEVRQQVDKQNDQIGSLIMFTLGGFLIGLFSSILVFYFVANSVLKKYLEFVLKAPKIVEKVELKENKVVEAINFKEVKPL